MGYPAAYRPGAAKYRPGGLGFQKPGPVSPPSNDNWRPPSLPANDNPPSPPRQIGGTAVSRGAFGAARLTLRGLGYIGIALTLGELLLELWRRAQGSQLHVPGNWSTVCTTTVPEGESAKGWRSGTDPYCDGWDIAPDAEFFSSVDPAWTAARYYQWDGLYHPSGNAIVNKHAQLARVAEIGEVPEWRSRQALYGWPATPRSKPLEHVLRLPWMRPIAMPVPEPDPLPYRARPGASHWPHKDIGYGRSPIVRTKPELSPRRPPEPGEKEKKFRQGGPMGRMLVQAKRAINVSTESSDFIEAIWDALPDEKHCRQARKRAKKIGGRVVFPGDKLYRDSGARFVQPKPQDMLRDIYRCFDQIDWWKAATNLAENHIEDFVIGKTNQLTMDNLKAAGWKFPAGHGLGPAL